ncbi:hypothetical protein [uncultured Fibrobacter sp.]|uniref:hypothetical protein n=1 Tax=uncultured Fibrobacter sp. TaxID=261512 RepID=UPI0026142B4A|nr:hypothetical protein [uncultured Fibrobacter sp.]
MEGKSYPCENCRLRARYDANLKSILGRLWRFHIRFCPGWRAYFRSLPPEKQQEYIERYNLK